MEAGAQAQVPLISTVTHITFDFRLFQVHHQ